jgi:hypothetical protein
MNERIKDLAEHCDFYVGNEHSDKSHEEKQRLWTKKFAELIVRECASHLNWVGDDAAGIELLEHFGVE